MRKLWLLSLAALAAGFGLSLAQPPEGGRKKAEGQEKEQNQPKRDAQPREPGQPGNRGEGRGSEGRREERKADPQVEAWVKTLAEKITDPHDEIRDSARAGLVAVGRPALPALQRIANSDDGAKVTAATKLIEAIETQQRIQAMMLGGGLGGGGGMTAGPITNARIGGGRGDTRPDTTPRPDGARPRDNPPGDPNRGNPFEQLIDDLGLNDKERQKVLDIHETLRSKMRELDEQGREGNAERETIREKRRELHEAMMKEMKEALSAEQFAKFEEGMKKMARPPRPERD